jgi:hypothetical protein
MTFSTCTLEGQLAMLKAGAKLQRWTPACDRQLQLTAACLRLATGSATLLQVNAMGAAAASCALGVAAVQGAYKWCSACWRTVWGDNGLHRHPELSRIFTRMFTRVFRSGQLQTPHACLQTRGDVL